MIHGVHTGQAPLLHTWSTGSRTGNRAQGFDMVVLFCYVFRYVGGMYPQTTRPPPSPSNARSHSFRRARDEDARLSDVAGHPGCQALQRTPNTSRKWTAAKATGASYRGARLSRLGLFDNRDNQALAFGSGLVSAVGVPKKLGRLSPTFLASSLIGSTPL